MTPIKTNIAVIILAAGLGTRMKSNKAKVLHKIQGKPMVLYVVETAKKVAGDDIVVVIGNQAEKVKEILAEKRELIFAYQEKQLGTGHAVLCALPWIPEHCEEVVILCGDVPLIQAQTVSDLVDTHRQARREVSLLAVELEEPHGYGRIIFDENNEFSEIIEERDATAEQKHIKLINTGIYCVNKAFLMDVLPKIRATNAQGEIYLTDMIAIGYEEKRSMGVMIGKDSQEILGINTRRDLERVEAIVKKQPRIIA